VTSTTNPRLEVSRSALDILNRPTWVSGPIVNDTTRYQYDALSNVTAVTDANNHVYTYQRNALGWVTKQIDPNAQADSSAYDIAGNVVYSRSRTGRVVKLDYDLLNRVTTKIGSAEHDTITYTFDAGNRWVAARTVSRGVLVSLDTLVVDSLGRTIREATYRPNAGYWANTSGYQFDKPGRVLSGLYQGVNAVRWIDFRYDSLQRPSEIRLLSGNSLLGYDAEQLPFSVTFPSGLIESTNYTSSHLPDTRFYSLPAVGNVFARSYLTDSLGRLVRRGEGSGGHFQDFYYDAKGRLAYWYKKTATSSTNCNNTTAYGYDCSQTILSTDSVTGAAYDAVGNPTELGGTADPGDRLLSYKSISMTYDLDGNMLSKGNDTYDWDDFGQLKGVTRLGATLATFDYDGFGRRIRKTSTSGGTVLYVWDGEQLSAEADAAGNLTQTYTYYPGMDRPHSVTTAAGVTYYTAVEPFGQIEGLIRGSDNAIVAQYSYNPWGELGANQDTVGGIRLNSLRWRGLVYDAETGLYQIRARYYDPKIRRFISEDPTGLGGGINQYTFALNDPVNNSDPSGREACRIEQGAEWSYTDEYGTHVVAEPNKIVCDVGGAFDWFRSVGEVLKLTFDFATGRGDNTRYYGPGSPQVNDMKNAPGVAKARADACQQVRDGSQPNVDDWHDFPKMEIIYAGLNPTRQFLGSHGTKVTALPNGHMQFTVYNTTSAHSALFHLDSVHNWGRDWYGVKHIPGGNMDQILSWTESNASCFQ
jgi:RHS repeat-associated protein